MPLLIAHRGASTEAPENTLPAIKRAWKRGADGVEIDIHYTRDNQLAVIHDGDTGRVAPIALPVERSTLAQLQTLDVGKWKKKRYIGRRIPSLEQAIGSIPRERWAFLELKSGPKVAPLLVSQLERSGLLRQDEPPNPTTMVCSFKLPSLSAVRDECVKRGLPVVPLGWICSVADVESLRHEAEREALFWRAEMAGCTWLSLAYSKVIDRQFMDLAHEHGFRVACWTVDKHKDAARLSRAGVDAIITNDPKAVGPYVHAHETTTAEIATRGSAHAALTTALEPIRVEIGEDEE